MNKKILEFYKQTSCFTDLGPYKNFAKNLTNNIKDLCLLLRNQTIHPFDMSSSERTKTDSVYGDMTTLPSYSIKFENDIFPTAIAILNELFRRENTFSIDRKIENKVRICCREQAVLLSAILKAKGIPTRCRSGFANYCCQDTSAGDHWITEYYNSSQNRWILVDSDMFFDSKVQKEYNIDFDLTDIPRDKFIFGAEAYLNLRKGKFGENDIHYASCPYTYGLKAAFKGLFFDFHSLMNNELIFQHTPKYIELKNRELSEYELKELDELATLMLEPDKNFNKLQKIWNTVEKFRTICGGLNS